MLRIELTQADFEKKYPYFKKCIDLEGLHTKYPQLEYDQYADALAIRGWEPSRNGWYYYRSISISRWGSLLISYGYDRTEYVTETKRLSQEEIEWHLDAILG